MTNNHCPKQPAIIAPTSRKNEIEVLEFAQKIMSQITEFAESQSMDEMIVIDSAILESWTECPRCESLICETQGIAYSKVIRTVMLYLNGEF